METYDCLQLKFLSLTDDKIGFSMTDYVGK